MWFVHNRASLGSMVRFDFNNAIPCALDVPVSVLLSYELQMIGLVDSPRWFSTTVLMMVLNDGFDG
jgi:hypothetical protein